MRDREASGAVSMSAYMVGEVRGRDGRVESSERLSLRTNQGAMTERFLGMCRSIEKMWCERTSV